MRTQSFQDNIRFRLSSTTEPEGFDSPGMGFGLMNPAQAPVDNLIGWQQQELAAGGLLTRMEALLTASESYQIFFDGSPIAMFMFDCDSGACLSMNEAARELYGFTDKDLEQVSFSELFGGEPWMANQKTRPKKSQHNSGYAVAGIWKNMRSDGRIIYAEVSIRQIVFESREICLVSVNDVTGRIQLEKSRMAFFKSSPDLMCIVDFKGNFRLLNPRWAKTLRYRSGELKKSTVQSFLHPDDVRFSVHAINKALRQGLGNVNFENRLLRKDGTTVDVSWRCTIDHDQRLIYAVARDITLQKELERERMSQQKLLEGLVKKRTREIKEVNKELEAFNYSVSHDLRTPIRAMELYTGILDSELHGTEQHAYVLQMNRCVEEMYHLIDDLLEFSKMGRTPLNKELVNMQTLVREVFELQCSIESRSEVDLQLEAIPPLVGDAKLIRIVLNNLLSNAIKYSRHKKKPVVCVGSEVRADRIVYFVQDNGVGFNPQYAHKLFKPFSRLHSGDKYKGNGAGLAIVERIITRHGGKIWAESKPDLGATFYFSIPNALSGSKSVI